jgi:Putative metallopeptidase
MSSVSGAKMRKLLGAAAFLAAFACLWPGSPARADDAADEELAAAEFVAGNAMFVMFHEIGHMLISAFDLPVLGKEEDAVDNLAIVLLLAAEDEVTAKALADSADAWFMFQERSEAAGSEDAFWDLHSLDAQRAYQIVCLMYGANAKQFKEVADAAELPPERRATCGEEFQQAEKSWLTLLSDHMSDDGAPKSKVKVVIDPPPPNMPAAEILKASGLVEESADFVASTFKLPFVVTFRLTSCGAVNAFWDPNERTVTYCYELGQEHLDLWNESPG